MFFTLFLKNALLRIFVPFWHSHSAKIVGFEQLFAQKILPYPPEEVRG